MKDWIKNIHTIDKTCVNSEGEYYKYTEFDRKPISLYIVVTRDCNARCPFCEYRGKLKKININKFEEIFIELSKYYDITTVHFTGGEPTLELDTINVLSKVIKEISPLTKTSVNTNGIFLNELSNIDTIDNIALSRHTIIDKDNFNIFRTNNIAAYEDIYNNNHKEKIHLSCNLIKGYIDSSDKILEYLEMASKLDINDVGFVSLMDINDYCEENFVEFSNIIPKEEDFFYKTRNYKCINNKNIITCKCENYLYRAKNMNFISMYHRYAIKNNEKADFLVYENNHLKQGFNGNIII